MVLSQVTRTISATGFSPGTISAAGLSTLYSWDCNGGLVTSTADPNGGVTSYSYATAGGVADPFWRIRKLTDPLSAISTYTYRQFTGTSPATEEVTLCSITAHRRKIH